MKNLEKLSADFCTEFTRVLKNPDNKNMKKIIGLYGADERILSSLKEHMQNYFNEKRQCIEVVLRKEGYEIDVGQYV